MMQSTPCMNILVLVISIMIHHAVITWSQSAINLDAIVSLLVHENAGFASW